MLTPELHVDLDRLAQNFALFQKATFGEVSAVVKSNAYGLGLESVASRLIECGCQSMFVTSLEEAVCLRKFFDGDLYLFSTFHDHASFQEIVDLKVIPILHSNELVKLWKPFAKHPCGLAFNTGMNRLGLTLEKINPHDLLRKLNIRLVMTHLACADEPDHTLNQVQLDQFDEVTKEFAGIRTSIGNSAGTLTGLKTQGDLTRPGIGLYGGNPFSHLINPTQVVAQCQVPLMSTYGVKKGETIGYGATYTAESSLVIGVVSMGYADGIPRHAGENLSLVFKDQLFPIVGRVSMELVTIDLSSYPTLKPGTFLEYFGRNQHVDTIAKQANTISYEVFTGIGPRVKRIYYPST